MSFCRLYYHLVWTTQDREPVITKDVECRLHVAIKGKIRALGGTLYEIDGTEDHVHVATSIPPSISVAKFVGEVKGVSSFHLNHQSPGGRVLTWAKGYGAVTFRRDNLEQVVAYIKQQKEHHLSGKVWASLEACDDNDVANSSQVKEEAEIYNTLPWG